MTLPSHRAMFLLALSMGLRASAAGYSYETMPADAKGQDFTLPSSTGPDRSVWTNVFKVGNGNAWYSAEANDGLMISIQPEVNKPANTDMMGFMQTTSGCSDGFGAGRFHWSARIDTAGQGPGFNLILWNADGSWANPRNVTSGGVYTIDEWDALETTPGQGWINVHTDDNGVSNKTLNLVSKNFTYPDGAGLTVRSDYDVDWVSGVSMTESINGVVVVSVTGPNVPKDHAHGGCNKTLGFQLTYQGGAEPTLDVNGSIFNAWWSPTVGSIGMGDAGTPADGGVAQDAGNPGDAGTPSDGNHGGGLSPDGGSGAAGLSGSGCGAVPFGAGSLLFLLPLALLLRRRVA